MSTKNLSFLTLLTVSAVAVSGCGKDTQINRISKPGSSSVATEQLVSESAASARVVGLADRYDALKTTSPNTAPENDQDGCKVGADFKKALNGTVKNGATNLLASTESVQALQGRMEMDATVAATAKKIMQTSAQLSELCAKQISISGEKKIALAQQLIDLSRDYRDQLAISKPLASPSPAPKAQDPSELMSVMPAAAPLSKDSKGPVCSAEQNECR